MGVIEGLARWANDQALEKTREVEIIERICVEPAEPVVPEDYRLSSEIQTQISDLTALKSEYDNLQGFLRVERPVPKRLEEKVPLPAESIKDLADIQDAQRARLAAINTQLSPCPLRRPALPSSCNRCLISTKHTIAGTEAIMLSEIAAWEHDRNANHTKADWQFTTKNARIELKHLYPSI